MWSHFGYHLAASIVLGGIVLWSGRWTQPPDELARRLRWALLAGLAVTLIGQSLEAIGAFGYPDNRPTNALENLHNLGVIVGPLGLLLLIFALVAAGALTLGTRLGFRQSRWFGVALGVAALAAGAFVVGAIIFGY